MSTTRRILATSGGFVPTDLWGITKPGHIIERALQLSGAQRPRVCLVMTASGDDPRYLSNTYAALGTLGCDVDHLALFPQPNRRPEEVLGRADVVGGGGGSVANLLALWRLHGGDTAMAEAWDRGAILGGVSAGSICWHVGGPTDSFGSQLRVVTDGLGFLPYGNGVHYDTEAQRRPLLHRLVADGTLPTSFATDDGVGILYEGTEPVEVIADSDAPTAAAYCVEASGGSAVETRLPVGRMSR